jgi:hypothetical protein
LNNSGYYNLIKLQEYNNNMREAWRHQLETELADADSARAIGNEGRARVCCRRAAGKAIREYLSRRGISASEKSAYDLINQLTEMPDIPPDLKEICVHLTMRVSEEFTLPADVDLVDETRQLCSALLPEWNSKS